MSDFSLFLLCPLCPCFRKVVARAAVSPRCRRHGATVMFSLKPAPLQLSPGTGYYVLLLMLLVLRPRDVVTSRAKHYYHQPQLSRGRTQTATASRSAGCLAPQPPRPRSHLAGPVRITDDIEDKCWIWRTISVEFCPSTRCHGEPWSWDEGDRGLLLAHLSSRCPLRRVRVSFATICCRLDSRLSLRLLRYDAVYVINDVIH